MAKTKKAAAPKIRIEHSRFGLGTIVEQDPHTTTVDFDEAGTRKFVTDMLSYEPSDVPAPARRKAVRKKKATKKKVTKKKTSKKSEAAKDDGAGSEEE